ncbi:hypothetical protein [Streptomyces sp. NPDC001020]
MGAVGIASGHAELRDHTDRYGPEQSDGHPPHGQLGCRPQIESVHGRELTVMGLDAVSGTPVIDLKPTMAEFCPVDIKQPEWVSRLMSEYFKP